jgi:hypothetical protein
VEEEGGGRARTAPKDSGKGPPKAHGKPETTNPLTVLPPYFFNVGRQEGRKAGRQEGRKFTDWGEGARA